MNFVSPVNFVQRKIADLLKAEPWFEAHNVKIVEQNSQELAFLLRTKLDEMRGVSLVVGVDGMVNAHTGLEMKITVTCTERVTINRAKQGFATAIDACCAAIQILDCADCDGIPQVWHFGNMTHEASREVDLLRASATFGGIVNREYIYSQEGEGATQPSP